VPHGYLSDEEGGEKAQREFLTVQTEQSEFKKCPKVPEIKGPLLVRHKRVSQFEHMACLFHADPLLLSFPFDAKVVRIPS
jgi:hypothetical protein